MGWLLKTTCMKIIYSVLLSISVWTAAVAQKPYLGNLEKQLSATQKEDTFRVLALSAIADYYGFLQFDSALVYALQVSKLSDKLNYTIGKTRAYRSMFFAYNCQGNYPKALEAALNINKLADELAKVNRSFSGRGDYFIGLLNLEMKDFTKAREQFDLALKNYKKSGTPESDIFFVYSQMANMYSSFTQSDSALWYARKGYELGIRSTQFKKYFALACAALGNIYDQIGNPNLAENYFRMGIEQSKEYNNIYFQARNYNYLAALFKKLNLKDSAVNYANTSLRLCQEHNFGEFAADASRILATTYDSENKTDSSLKYFKIMVAARDSVFSQSRGQQFQQFAFNEIQRRQEISASEERYKSQVKMYGLSIALILFSLLAFSLFRNNRQKQRAKINIEKAYDELKSTQAQLIQNEKMASLGELTAGIAHEIQNPMNFINNFSEINSELLDEMREEIKSGNSTEAFGLSEMIRENNSKINFHGKRADSIVKSMLLHSRTSSGIKEPTDINQLADEYLRLAYHGLRARDSSFNVTMKTDFEPDVLKIDIVPQDIGRVLLNLYNNAFYSVGEKKRQMVQDYLPIVEVRTKKLGNKFEITIRDNGKGIPKNILDKIFQPFFTTKPTGQGTGLGLSLSYDIIKTHGGEIKVETAEGSYTEFKIILPFKK
jgi:two-component system, NtrC family, sensor kinase